MPQNNAHKPTQKRLKQEAKALQKGDPNNYPKHADALNAVARKYQFPNWIAAKKACPEK